MSDPILYWNEVSLEANRVSHTDGNNEQTGPTRSSRALAIVHLAMYDAYAGVVNVPALPRYIATPAAPAAGASAAAAIAAAAYTTLTNLFPSQKASFDLAFASAGNPLDPGHAFGVKVGEAILADRERDPHATNPDYVPSKERGKHRVDPDNPGQGFHGAYYGARSKGFAIRKRFMLAPPPKLNSNEYRRALRQVRGLGIAPELMGTLPDGMERRNANQTLIGTYWAYDGMPGLGTPPRQYNQIIRKLAETRSPNNPGQPNDVAQNARLFAFVNAAMADAAILAWEQKYCHDLWRPVVAIREDDESMGPGATTPANKISDDCDPAWLPLGAPRSNQVGKNVTPPFPAYPSGHATFGAAAFHITRLFYGVLPGNREADDLFNELEFVSDELNGVTTDNKATVRPRHVRGFPKGLWDMIIENGRSRVFLGVHWVFDAFAVDKDNNLLLDKQVDGKFVGGVPLGLQIAEDIFEAGGGVAPVKSTVKARITPPCPPVD